MIVQYYYYVDGVEIGPFGPASSPLVGGSEPVVGSSTGLHCNDSLADHTIDTSLNFFKIGTSGYGSSEIFNDPFSSTGFTMWDNYSAGTGGTYLTEGSGVAHLAFTSKHLVGVTIELFDHDLDHDNVYWTVEVKCPVSSSPTARIDTYDPDAAILDFATDGVTFTFVGVDSDTTAADLDDGNWHTVGMRRERLGSGTPVEVVATISHTFGLDV